MFHPKVETNLVGGWSMLKFNHGEHATVSDPPPQTAYPEIPGFTRVAAS